MDKEHARRVYFEQLRRAVPLAAVLEHYGVLKRLRGSGRNLQGACPIHGGCNKRQFSVDLQKNVWRCFSPDHVGEDGGGMLEFVTAMEKTDIYGAALKVSEWFAIRPVESSVQRKEQRRKTVSGEKPSHKAYVVEERDGEDRNGFWTRVGSAWPHGDGKGLNVQIATGVAVSGRIVLREYSEEDVTEDDKKAAAKKKR